MLLIRIAELVVVLAGIVLVPLGLSAAAQPNRKGEIDRLERIVARLFPAAGIGLALALAWPGRLVGLVLSSVYVAACAAVAWIGARRMARRSRFRLEEAAVDVGMVYLVVGGAWMFAYINDIAILGFAGLQSWLTAA